MSELNYQVLDSKGSEVGSALLDPAVFGAPIHEKSVHMVVRYQLAKRRAGTHSTLGRSDMQGGGKKPFRQKGTGHARAGSGISPLWTGGAVLFGPKPRSYEFKVGKGVRRKAMLSVLSDKARQGTLRIVDDLQVPSGKTKDIKAVLKALSVDDGKVLMVLPEKDEMVWRAARNLPNVILLPVEGFNVYDAMRTRYLVSTRAGVEALQARFKDEGSDEGREE